MGNDLRKTVIAFTSVAAAFALFAVAGIFVLDGAAAGWALSVRGGSSLWTSGPALLDTLTLRDGSAFLLGSILLIAGGVLLIARSTRRSGWMLLFVGAVQFTTTILAHLLSPMFGRLPPREAMANPGGMDFWLAGGGAFPSEQTAFYAGLFFPLMLIFPRWTFLLAVPPLLVAAAQVRANMHFLSDVSASLALAALVTGGLAFILSNADDY